ncbi:MAG: NYN domain-containing protein [Bacteroidetes bacterium]|nr:NYN domain-containing protein [Bacteroidota bacterium]MCY4224707.1 NYN domain-containing protein [Bacteroidota bacterium]
MIASDSRLTRIGIYYDGRYFQHVSDYYFYNHERKARLSISGLHTFLREEVAKCEHTDARYCQIVDAHYFRGRLISNIAKDRGKLESERRFEDVLLSEGVTCHFTLIHNPTHGEKGIDVWLSLEAFELAIYKRYDVCVLITGDGDFVPLVRKLNTLGTRVMLLAWDFEYTDEREEKRQTKTAQSLIDESTYAVMMNDEIDKRSRKDDHSINNLFLNINSSPSPQTSYEEKSWLSGSIITLNKGFGFINPDNGGENIFFHYSSVVGDGFNDLGISDRVEYQISREILPDGKNPPASKVRITMKQAQPTIRKNAPLNFISY